MEAIATRVGVFKEVHTILDSDDEYVHIHMDATLPYIPEMSNYQVVSLIKGLCSATNHWVKYITDTWMLHTCRWQTFTFSESRWSLHCAW